MPKAVQRSIPSCSPEGRKIGTSVSQPQGTRFCLNEPRSEFFFHQASCLEHALVSALGQTLSREPSQRCTWTSALRSCGLENDCCLSCCAYSDLLCSDTKLIQDLSISCSQTPFLVLQVVLCQPDRCHSTRHFSFVTLLLIDLCRIQSLWRQGPCLNSLYLYSV